MKKSRQQEIENRLRQAFQPLHLKVEDQSAKHLAHAGAKDGRGHFKIQITAHAFHGKTLAESHRMIYTILGDMMKTDIHALQIETKPIELPELTELVIEIITGHKAQDIKVLDVSSLTDVMDIMIVCTATSIRHAASMADKLAEALRKIGIKPYNKVEDQTETGWILVDLLDIVVHIMLAETREFYSLEKLWTVTETQRDKH